MPLWWELVGAAVFYPVAAYYSWRCARRHPGSAGPIMAVWTSFIVWVFATASDSPPWSPLLIAGIHTAHAFSAVAIQVRQSIQQQRETAELKRRVAALEAETKALRNALSDGSGSTER